MKPVDIKKWNLEDLGWINSCKKCCSICMSRYTHLCNSSCFYKMDIDCGNCVHYKQKKRK